MILICWAFVGHIFRTWHQRTLVHLPPITVPDDGEMQRAYICEARTLPNCLSVQCLAVLLPW
jgi:hypothetical protein